MTTTMSASRAAMALMLLLSLLILVDGSVSWTSWSAWSECSRTCDGGASYQLRKCSGRQRCEGDSIRYRTCNRMPCPVGSVDFRAQQCAAYNDVLYEGRLYQWVPISEPRDPCSLRCRATSQHFSVMLAPKVLDGTRCDDSSIDICINGRCRKVGCDGLLESTAAYDVCGVCGGDGTSCGSGGSSRRHVGSHSNSGGASQQQRPHRQLFRWVEAEAGPCSVTCGVGLAKISVVCKDQRNNQVVYNTYCTHLPKPRPPPRQCTTSACPPVWITGEWGACSRSCGGGTSRRHVYCVEELHDGGFRNTFSRLCITPRPVAERRCNEYACPRWYAGSWSPCSVTCAKGVQHREVICRRTPHQGCQLSDRPATRRSCDTYVTCMGQKASHTRSISGTMSSSNKTSNPEIPMDYNILNEIPLSSKTDEELDDFLNSLIQGGNASTFLSSSSDKEKPKLTLSEISENEKLTLSELEVNENKKLPSSSTPTPSIEEIVNSSPTTKVALPATDTESIPTATKAVAPPRHQKIRILQRKPDDVSSTHFIPETPGEGTDENINPQETYFLYVSGRKTTFLDTISNRVWDTNGRNGSWNDHRRHGEKKISGGRQEDQTEPVMTPDGDQESQKHPGDAAQNALLAGVSTMPKFLASEWGECSATCGYGIRTRLVICKVYLKFSQTVQDLPEADCDDEKPQEVEQCHLRECPETSDLGVVPLRSYRWRHDGYSTCNVSCLGGVQSPTYKCVDRSISSEVDTSLCTGIAKPLVDKRRCNDVPCPPRWRVESFRPCSALCGGGYRRRRVECIQELSRGEQNVAVLQDSECPPPIPPRSILCNLLDCPPSWVIAGDWSQCSVTCGEGLSTRQVLCQQVVAPGRVQNVSLVDPTSPQCPPDQPDSRRPCYGVPCPEMHTSASERLKRVTIETDSTRYLMLAPARKLQLVVGGQAVLLPSVNLVVRCPATLHYDRKLVYWRKNNELLPRRGRIKVSRHGALHLKRASPRDTGVYTCVVDANSANISVSFHTQEHADGLLNDRLHYLTYNYKELLHDGSSSYYDQSTLDESHQGVDDNRVLPLRQHHVASHRSSSRRETHGRSAGHIGERGGTPHQYQKLLATLDGGSNISALPYVYFSGRWSRCSQTCGYRGVKWRNVTCEQVTQRFIRQVDGLHCHHQGLAEPLATQDCGMYKCPHWEVGPWSRCSGKRCSRPSGGMSTRALYCVLDNGTTTSHDACDLTQKPEPSRECRYDECVPKWRPSDWSECSRSCGGLGMKRRTLKCVWANNGDPAGRYCRGVPRPPTDQVCRAPNCHRVVCVDKSSTCRMIPRLKLCHIWHKECCWSCHARIG